MRDATFQGPFAQGQLAGVGAASPAADAQGNALYTGTIHHIFFHSLIVYPEKAFDPANKKRDLYRDYMITRDQFQKILPQLYAKGYMLVDVHDIYSVGADGQVSRKNLYLPLGKKPLILSIDDVSYYQDQYGGGLARRLVLEKSGKVATEIAAPDGTVSVTRDGDIVPILDDFVQGHPDFSLNGAKGILALTGYDGILGYRVGDTESARPVVDRLKAAGWSFASHSYTHGHGFLDGTISLADLKADTEQWKREVMPVLGDTDVFVGPFGQIFRPGDPRRAYLVSQGFKMLCGVGMDDYLAYFKGYVVQDRADIDGYRIAHDPQMLRQYFGAAAL